MGLTLLGGLYKIQHNIMRALARIYRLMPCANKNFKNFQKNKKFTGEKLWEIYLKMLKNN